MTLRSFITVRPPALDGAASTSRCSTVCGRTRAISDATAGVRRSTHSTSTPSTRYSGFGSRRSTATIRSTGASPGTPCSSRSCSTAAPSRRAAPVTRIVPDSLTRSFASRSASTGPPDAAKADARKPGPRPRTSRPPPASWPDARHAYFLLRRWMRVFFSSLRCFLLAMRLRRFLMTEPTWNPRSLFTDVQQGSRVPALPSSRERGGSMLGTAGKATVEPGRTDTVRFTRLGSPDQLRPRRSAGLTTRSSLRADIGPGEILAHRLRRDPKGPADPHRGQLAGVDHPVDGHLRHPHQPGDFGDREEAHVFEPGALAEELRCGSGRGLSVRRLCVGHGRTTFRGARRLRHPLRPESISVSASSPTVVAPAADGESDSGLWGYPYLFITVPASGPVRPSRGIVQRAPRDSRAGQRAAGARRRTFERTRAPPPLIEPCLRLPQLGHGDQAVARART